MLRDYFSNLPTQEFTKIFVQFDTLIDVGNYEFEVIDSDELSPDSFFWKVRVNNELYYMYAEDYVPGLKYISDIINSQVGNDNWEFVKTRETKTADSATPVQHASVYNMDEDSDEMMAYAAQSGFDFVFLVKLFEDVSKRSRLV